MPPDRPLDARLEAAPGFQALRVSRAFTFTVSAPPAAVFPLLCPVREHDWIDGWSAQVVFSHSGLAEDHCVFRTPVPGQEPATWVVTGYEPDRHIAFAVFTPGLHVQRLEVDVAPAGPGSTLTWTRTYTGLTDAGNVAVTQATGPALEARMEGLRASLEHYLTTGTMLRKSP